MEALGFIWYAMLGWAIICSARTGLIQIRLVEAIDVDRRDFWELMSKFDRVSFERHLVHIFFCLDWRELYHPDLIKLANVND